MSDIEKLRKVKLFRGLTDKELEALAAIVKSQEVSSNSIIIQEGTEGDNMYVLMEGKVQVSRSLTLKVGTRAFEERDKNLMILDGDMSPAFGEMSLIDRSPRSATVSSITHCRLLVIDKQGFEQLCQRDYHLGFVLFRNMAEDLSTIVRRNNQDILKLTTALSIALSR